MNNLDQPYHRTSSQPRRSNNYLPPPRRIDARAPYASPENNQGASHAPAQIMAGWGWGSDPQAAGDEIKRGWGWGSNTPGAVTNPQPTPGNAATGSATAQLPQAAARAGGSATAQSPQNAPGPKSPTTAQGWQRSGNAAYDALTQSPFANGQKPGPSTTPGMVRQTGAGTYVDIPGVRNNVAVSPTLDQTMDMHTDGQWQGWSPAQRAQYLRGQTPPAQSSPQPAATAKATGVVSSGEKPAAPVAAASDANAVTSMTLTDKNGNSQVINRNPSVTISAGGGPANYMAGNSPLAGEVNLASPMSVSQSQGDPILSGGSAPGLPAAAPMPSGSPSFMDKAPGAGGNSQGAGTGAGGLPLPGGGRIYFGGPGKAG